jgi:hypothetical protein
LFAALSLSWRKQVPRGFIYTLAGVGICVSISTFLSLHSGTKAIERLRDWWIKNLPQLYNGPGVVGWPNLAIDGASGKEKGLEQYFHPQYALPFCFLFGWIAVIIITIQVDEASAGMR